MVSMRTEHNEEYWCATKRVKIARKVITKSRGSLPGDIINVTLKLQNDSLSSIAFFSFLFG